MTPDPKLWARLEKWLRENPQETFTYWINGREHTIVYDYDNYIGHTFNAALRRFLKAVGV